MTFTLNYIGLIDDAFVATLSAQMQSLSNDVDTLCIVFNSQGGSVSAGVAAYNLLKGSRFKLITHNLGEVSSAAILPYLAGSVRTTEDHAKFGLHPLEITFQTPMAKPKLEELYKNICQDIDNYVGIIVKEVPRLSEKYDVVSIVTNSSLVLSSAESRAVGIVTA